MRYVDTYETSKRGARSSTIQVASRILQHFNAQSANINNNAQK